MQTLYSTRVIHGETLGLNINCMKKERFRAVREIVQKKLKQLTKFQKEKKQCKQPDGSYICPCCSTNVHHLTIAHVGESHANILARILKDNPDMGFDELLKRDIEENFKAKFMTCCSSCNNNLDGFVPDKTFAVEDIDHK